MRCYADDEDDVILKASVASWQRVPNWLFLQHGSFAVRPPAGAGPISEILCVNVKRIVLIVP
jgi:hypothetical protein